MDKHLTIDMQWNLSLKNVVKSSTYFSEQTQSNCIVLVHREHIIKKLTEYILLKGKCEPANE